MCFLLSMGAIGGGPTFVGTVGVHGFTSEAVSVVFLTLAHRLLTGLIAGFLTDALVTAVWASPIPHHCLG